ncbi:protein ANKUB1-like [Ctenopharyngodon idella]|uniref:protein ANKUB1-like n=1 Tax=Ctenopharyngodon idella TaxID=7959 RepID=UPI00222FB921|nr:protein ANKUB1-like [Ctenopharyngodon idella]
MRPPIQKEVNKAILHMFNAIMKDTFPIMGLVTLLRSFVSKLKSVVSLQLGIPVSSFRLSTRSSLHLYDCNLLRDYAVQANKLHLPSSMYCQTSAAEPECSSEISKLYTTVNCPWCSLPMHIYLQNKTWIHKVQAR